MNENCSKATRRVNKIDWNNMKYTNRKSDLVLAKEFIRRAAMFFVDISQDSKTAFFSAANILKKDFILNIEAMCPKVTELSLYNKLACKHYIEGLFS
ncbi:hypothetical protein PaecuDRAFT_4820 [Paenibacillus curdlanolyticus YK9]|uniref:Uncharacterized protein n=1 Tax=Paenibacillus curdlanolyticus YK9 TaxID=717606 RepID=E0IGM5_9BACL|nr:hypothetical protein [Paenibacillus curdlanolyticus]EFM08377.1 hypothetical protein PaecuDRAFT_4820 [Paenibacillus curdlanolyticus YK9]